jgi:hypothetical protein
MHMTATMTSSTTSSTKDLTWYLKWVATVVLIAGTAVNSAGFYPAGPLILLLGGVMWLIVSIRWKEPSLIVSNLVMTLASIGGMAYAYLK